MIIAYNFGHYHPDLGGGVFAHAEIFTCKTFRQFADEVRNPIAIRGIMDYAEKSFVARSTMTLLVNIDNKHYFRIRLKNVREYKQAVEDWIADKAEKKEKYWTE